MSELSERMRAYADGVFSVLAPGEYFPCGDHVREIERYADEVGPM
jgi:hypothetical protein